MSRKRVILDADILSMFAKVDAIEVLGEFLGRGRMGMGDGRRMVEEYKFQKLQVYQLALGYVDAVFAFLSRNHCLL